MPTKTDAQTNTMRTLQGQTVPANAINPGAFFAMTRRKRYAEYSRPFAGLGQTDVAELRKSDILGVLHVHFAGSLTTVKGTGTVAATYRWPYDLLAAARFTANGASNLVNVSGAKLKFRDLAARSDRSDRGVSQPVGASTATQGTLSQSSESWGVGPGQTAIADGTYDVVLYWKIPVAEDEKDLAGAIFCQTSSMDLTLSLDWATASTLFVLTNDAAVTLTGQVTVEAEKYSIPAMHGSFVLPDLSLFHSIVQTSVQSGVSTGDNELRLVGQGVSRQLVRLFYQVWSGATPKPLAADATNFGPQGWRYGTNETPELFPNGRSLRAWNENIYGVDTAAVFGFLCHEFASTWGFRDTVDMGQASDLRLYTNIKAALTSPTVEYVQEVMFPAGS